MKFDFSNVDPAASLSQIPKAVRILLSTPAFISKHKIWSGFLKNTWVVIFSIIIAVGFSYVLFNDLHHYFSPEIEQTIDLQASTEGIDEGIKALEEATELLPEESSNDELEAGKVSLEEAKESIEGDHKSLFSGSLKFLLLIFLEVLVFHFAVRTNNILKNENHIPKFKSFYNAQVRMIKVMGRKWLYGLIMYILISILFGIAGIGELKDSFMFLIYGYYMGFAFLDNYLEQYHYTIDESAAIIQSHLGASVVFGAFASLLMHIPLIGPLVMPFICGIAATRYGHEYNLDNDRISHVPSASEHLLTD